MWRCDTLASFDVSLSELSKDINRLVELILWSIHIPPINSNSIIELHDRLHCCSIFRIRLQIEGFNLCNFDRKLQSSEIVLTTIIYHVLKLI